MNLEGEPYLSHHGLVHGFGMLEQFYELQEETKKKGTYQRKPQRSVGCKCQLKADRCGPKHGGPLFFVKKKKNSAIFVELNTAIKEVLGVESWGKTTKVCIRRHHFDQRVLDPKGEPYSYIHNEELAHEIYPEPAIFEKARVTNCHLWKVLPTKNTEVEDTNPIVRRTADVAPLEVSAPGHNEESSYMNIDRNEPLLYDDIAINSDNSDEEMNNYLSGNHLDHSQILLDEDGDTNMSSARKKPPSLFATEAFTISPSHEYSGAASMSLLQNTMTASRSSEMDDDQWNPTDTGNDDSTSAADHSNSSPPIDRVILSKQYATPLRSNEKDKRSKGSTVRAGLEKLSKRFRTTMTTIMKHRRKKTKTTGGPSPIQLNLDGDTSLKGNTDVLVSHIDEILKLCENKDGSIRKEVNGLIVSILDKNMKHRKIWNKYEPIQISYIESGSKKEVQRCITCVPVFKATSDHPRKVARGAKLMRQVVENMAGENDTALQQAIILNLATNLGGTLRWSQSTWLDVVDCMTLRERGGVSSTKIIEILQSAGKLLRINNFCPKRLHKKFREEHLKRLLEVAYTRVNLQGKQTIMYWIKNQPLLVERLIASSLMDGTYQKSEEFCNIANSEIILRGIDKGFEDISDLIRLVNRKDGNSGLYCIPICTVEDADENYENLERTSFRDEIGKLMNQIYADKFHLLSIIGESKVTGGSFEKDARCVMIAFKHSDTSFDAHLTLKEISVKVGQHISLSTADEVETFKNRSVHATNNRDECNQMDINLDHVDVNRFHMNMQMVRISFDDEERANEMKEEGHDTFIGCKISSEGKELLSFLFDHPMQVPCSATSVEQQLSGHCRKLKLFNCDDGKMTANTCGLRSCNATFSCPCCIRPTASYSIERWIEKYSKRFGDTVHILSLAHRTKKDFNHRAFRFEFQCNGAINYDQAHLNPKIQRIEETNDILSGEDIHIFESNSQKSDLLETIDPINLSFETLKKVENCETDRFELNLIIRMIRANKVVRKEATPPRVNDEDSGNAEGTAEEVLSYIGCKVISILPNESEEEICSIEFKSPIAVAAAENLFGAQFRQAISLHSKDNVMLNSIIGLDTCRSKPFVQERGTATVARRNEVFKDLKKFQNIIRKEGRIAYNFDEYQRREGEFSHQKSFAKGEDIRGENLEKTTAVDGNMDKAILAAHSVMKKPLRFEDCNKFISDCLHAFEGMVTHLNETAVDLLKEIDNRKSDHPSSWNMLQHLNHTTERIREEKERITSSTEYTVAKKQYTSNNQRKGIKARYIEKERKKKEDEQDLSSILKWEQEIEEFESHLNDALEGKGLGLMNRKLRGCSELEKEVNERIQKEKDKKKKSKKMMGQSEFVFTQGIRSQAGKFNKQHGGLELTGARSLLLLERREAIDRLMQNTYTSDPKKKEDVSRVIREFWLPAAKHLYSIGKIMKSQEKIDDLKLESFESHLVDFLIIWLKYSSEIKTNPIYWKLHNMLCSVKKFASIYRMIG